MRQLRKSYRCSISHMASEGLQIMIDVDRMENATVRVESGMLQGAPSADGALTAFKGIPYAAPPVGLLRWKPPHPPLEWQGVRPADTFGPICPQLGPAPGSFYQQEFYLHDEPQSGDCLYLNVWTAARAASERRPVMVWFHGGA